MAQQAQLPIPADATSATFDLNGTNKGTVNFGQGGITISATTQANVIAPAPIWLEATNPTGFTFSDEGIAGYTPAHHEITYVWTVRGSPFAAFTAPVNMMTNWNNPNVAYGPKVAMCLPDAGDYTIDLWCVKTMGVDAGITAVDSFPITVLPADDRYPGTQTAVYSNIPGETWAGKPAGAVECTTRAEVEAWMSSNVFSAPARLLFRKNVETDEWENARLGLGDSGGRGVEQIGSWGASGTRPKFTNYAGAGLPLIRLSSNWTPGQLTVYGLRHEGDWDAELEVGTTGDFINLTRPGIEGSFGFIYDCYISGNGNLGIKWDDALANSYFVCANMVLTNWKDYGFLSSGAGNQKTGFFGCDLSCNPNAAKGGGKNKIYNTHGCIRDSFSGGLYVGMTSFLQRHGWTGGQSDPDGDEQPCIRAAVSGASGIYDCFDRISCEGGASAIVWDAINENRANPGTHIVDKALFVSSAKTNRFMVIELGGTTIRNVLCVNDNKLHQETFAAFAPMGVNGSTDQGQSTNEPENLIAPIRIYNNTFLNVADYSENPANAPWNWSAVTDQSGLVVLTVEEENNLIHAPLQSVPYTPDGTWDLNSDIAGWVSRHLGLRNNYISVKVNLDAGNTSSGNGTVAQGESFTVPYSAINSDDWFNTGTPPTDQQYWIDNEAAEQQHMLVENGLVRVFSADPNVPGDQTFSVTFGTDLEGVTVTNNSASLVWGATPPGGTDSNIELQLDRRGVAPAMLPEYANPSAITMPTPTGDVTPDTPLLAYDDIFLARRPNKPWPTDHLGLPTPTGDDSKGAESV